MTDQHDQSDAWVSGEMPPDEAAHFERDAGLDAARQWFAAEPPGINHADNLSIPRVAIRNPKSAIRNLRWVWQMAAAASIFGGGVCIGRISMPDQPANVVEMIGTPPAQEIPTPAPTEESGQSPDLPKAAPQRYVRQDDGRVVIETTLADSGAHATWVIDGSFKLASNETLAQ